MSVRPLLFLLAAAAPLAAPLSARAADLSGWDATRWGMSSAEIARLYGARTVRLPGRVEFDGFYSDVALRRADLGGNGFIVYFQMDDRTGRLAQVLLERLKQYATAAAWDESIAALTQTLGPPTAVCDRAGKPFAGAPGVLERVWVMPTTTVRASFLAFSAANPERAPQDDGGFGRRLLIRYAPTREGTAACP